MFRRCSLALFVVVLAVIVAGRTAGKAEEPAKPTGAGASGAFRTRSRSCMACSTVSSSWPECSGQPGPTDEMAEEVIGDEGQVASWSSVELT